jgi:Flp pilus assembly protein TadG
MNLLQTLRRDSKGVGAVEFALIAPAFFGMLIGITALGEVYFAKADLRNAVAAGARQAAIYPQPDKATIENTIKARFVRLKSGRASVTVSDATPDTNNHNFEYREITATYAVPINFVIYKPRPITLIERRRVFLQPVS